MPILRPYADRELRAARLRLLRLRDELCLIRRDHFYRKYNPNQPRVPSGNAGGGQWTSGAGGGGSSGGGTDGGDPLSPDGSSLDADTGWSSLGEGWNEDGSIFEQTVTDGEGTTIRSEYAASREASFDERQTVIQPDGNKTSFETTGNVQSIYDGGPDGDLVARTTWTASGPEPDATVQPAFAPLVATPTIITGGAILFGWMSPFNGIDGQQAVMGFNARDYQLGDATSGKLDLSFSGRIAEEQAELACRRLPDVRELADRAANATGSPELYPSRTVYGTDVHTRFAQYVNDLNDFRFRAERSFLKEQIEGVDSQKVPYGYPRPIRVDAYEYRDDGTLCVYDLKTGKAGLADRRADILANAIKLGFNSVRRVIVMEVRPRQ
ncbi:hypothetical protein [Bosea beijingensis]|uniref:hypothetical protein n=1 Tax=Bosea beijingensis TaxID=3068632 RepID=UPI0027404442|nr:hypothetical protein [Bosea sp. REN20]